MESASPGATNGQQLSTCNNKVVECQLCGYYSPSLTLHVSHLRLVHSDDPTFNIMCSIGGCMEAYRRFSAYSSHVYRHHRVALGLETLHDKEDIIPSTTASVEKDTPSSSTSTSVDATFLSHGEDAIGDQSTGGSTGSNSITVNSRTKFANHHGCKVPPSP